jgi:hypothetical protein
MRFEIYLIALLLSAIIWVMSYDVAKDGYRGAEEVGAFPNLHVRNHLHRLLDDVRPE